VLDCFAENIHHMGEVGAGHQMKLLHNYVSLGTVTVIAEAAACARKSGIAPEEFVDVLHKGGGWGAALERLKPYLLNDGDTSNLRFSLSNASKDLGYYTTYAADTHADHTVAAAIKQTITQECDAGHGDEHMPNMIAYIAARSGRDGTPH
jgi:3-hydroxyisobutyrate dehydrogenase-like beta-hydroxyacid dehydrogenase